MDIPIVHTLYETYALWHEVVLKFPKSERYTLAHQCANHLLAALEATLLAAAVSNPAEKRQGLQVANVKLDLVKLLVRLAKDCKSLSNTHYLAMESKIHEAGKMLGGWIKSLS